jgi:hypothetical protein
MLGNEMQLIGGGKLVSYEAVPLWGSEVLCPVGRTPMSSSSRKTGVAAAGGMAYAGAYDRTQNLSFLLCRPLRPARSWSE